MSLKETVIYNIRLTDCYLGIKSRHLFHLSGFHFGQHHEDFDNTENNQLKYVWVTTQKGFFVSNAVVSMDLSYSVLSYPNSEDSHIVLVSSGRFTLVKIFIVDQNCGKKMSIPVHDKKIKTQVSKLEINNTPFSHAVKKIVRHKSGFWPTYLQ